jgi:tetratricopeptide (TPR) repeat protein
MRSMKFPSTCLVFTASLSILAGAQTVAPFQFLEKPGPYAVGLKVVEQYDYSRAYRPAIDELGKPFVGERARPLQTLIWYPAVKSDAKPMTVQSYVDLWPTETSFGKPNMPPDGKAWQKGMSPTLADAMWSVRNANIEAGRYPVVIYAPSLSSQSWENADLCEYLASHGYVVIAAPDMGVSTREMTADIPGIEAQAADISFLIGFAQTLPDTDMSEIAVGGFSWGGISNLFAAARDNRIDALFGLDGSLRYFPGLVKASGYVHPDQMTLPLLAITQGEISFDNLAYPLGKDRDGPGVLKEWTHGDLMKVEMLGFAHAEHSSMYQRNEDIWKEMPSHPKADYGREDGAPGYAWMARYTLEFLDAYLKHDATAMAFLKNTPAENGVPKHFISASFRAGKGIPTTEEAFRTELGRQGFEHAGDIYATMKKENPDFKLDEAIVTSWAYDIMADHLPEATALLKLDVTLYPDSWNAYDSLGEAYMKGGQKQLAIENYRKSLEKDPSNTNAVEKLKELSVEK